MQPIERPWHFSRGCKCYLCYTQRMYAHILIYPCVARVEKERYIRGAWGSARGMGARVLYYMT